MWYHLTHKKSGEEQTVASLDGYDVDDFEVAELDLPEDGLNEFQDVKNGEVVHNAEREANVLAGPEHIAEARLQKRIEAAIIKSGYVLSAGLLATESVERGISLDAMADIIVAKNVEFEAVEIARQVATIEPVESLEVGLPFPEKK